MLVAFTGSLTLSPALPEISPASIMIASAAGVVGAVVGLVVASVTAGVAVASVTLGSVTAGVDVADVTAAVAVAVGDGEAASAPTLIVRDL